MNSWQNLNFYLWKNNDNKPVLWLLGPEMRFRSANFRHFHRRQIGIMTRRRHAFVWHSTPHRRSAPREDQSSIRKECVSDRAGCRVDSPYFWFVWGREECSNDESSIFSTKIIDFIYFFKKKMSLTCEVLSNAIESGSWIRMQSLNIELFVDYLSKIIDSSFRLFVTLWPCSREYTFPSTTEHVGPDSPHRFDANSGWRRWRL